MRTDKSNVSNKPPKAIRQAFSQRRVGQETMSSQTVTKPQKENDDCHFTNENWSEEFGSKAADSTCYKTKNQVPPHLLKVNKASVWYEILQTKRGDEVNEFSKIGRRRRFVVRQRLKFA